MRKIIFYFFLCSIVSVLTSFLFVSYYLQDKALGSSKVELVGVNSSVDCSEEKFTTNTKRFYLPDLTIAADKSIDAVVHVSKYVQSRQSYNDILLQYFFGQSSSRSRLYPVSTGSGVIISEDGYIVTNYHVIKGASELQITLNDNRTYVAKVVGFDSKTDIALLKISETNLTFLEFGDSNQLKIGEWVLAVGNPFNLKTTVTAGIVSAKSRNIGTIQQNYAIESFIQTDAAVNPGNSGGALLNIKGELVGINTAIASETGSFVGYSFAVPSSIAKEVVNDLKEYGEVQRPILGISIIDMSYEIAQQLGESVYTGIFVRGVFDSSAAHRAGILSGDIIVSINDVDVKDVGEMQKELSRYRIGEKIDVTVIRQGNRVKKTVELCNK
ncbi:MAG: trypsin-like peptidase domain-containing protein [Bacteroidales bacterium]|nr:trypsin-like peptidase domain-containing protein [Bacteroidales bacterium]